MDASRSFCRSARLSGSKVKIAFTSNDCAGEISGITFGFKGQRFFFVIAQDGFRPFFRMGTCVAIGAQYDEVRGSVVLRLVPRSVVGFFQRHRYVIYSTTVMALQQ